MSLEYAVGYYGTFAVIIALFVIWVIAINDK